MYNFHKRKIRLNIFKRENEPANGTSDFQFNSFIRCWSIWQQIFTEYISFTMCAIAAFEIQIFANTFFSLKAV